MTTEPTDPTAPSGQSAPTVRSRKAAAKATPAEIATKPTAAKKAAAKRASATKATATKATATKATGTKATGKTAAGAKGAAKKAAPPSRATSTPARAGGAFAAGAARASGERRRRTGTPLLPAQPVEVSDARRRSVGAAGPTPPDGVVEVTDTPVTVDVPTGQADDVELATMEPSATPAGDDSTTRDAAAQATATDATATDAPAADATDASATATDQTAASTDDTARPAEPTAPAGSTEPTEPTTPRSRPSRASMRSTRPSANGEPKRLRAVPPVHEPAPSHPQPDAQGTRRHTRSGDEGWDHALTSGLQSRAEKLVGAVLEGAEFTSESRPGPAELVELAVNVLRAAATSAGVPAEDVERQVAETLSYVRRRLSGDYVVDEFGFDEDYTINVHLPLLRPLYKKWFRVEVRGIENIPDEGGALVVGNHSGTVAMDSLMTQVAVYDEHPKKRHLRMLGADLVFQMPFIGTMARRSGTTLAANTDAERLLAGGSLVGVWPEGFKGVGKPFSERYKLQRFGRGGFVSAALRAGVPIVPVSIVGAEEIYPILGNMPAVARLLGLPYAPITPTFPLLGPLGMVPLPSKWLIEFGPPIQTTTFGPEAADDPMLVFDLTDQVRETIQQTLYSLLMQRKSVFL
ncbi:1-acyl-sn-glycerol-3-phosphate acyltransferase [Terrabacter sp. 2RAF25]|uniref:lysophospholipid acyltransferase family protein n=1 Tax=Terrabacter sp. 2RAF25 TaxID=3232998 RepID=UPI003F953384